MLIVTMPKINLIFVFSEEDDTFLSDMVTTTLNCQFQVALVEMSEVAITQLCARECAKMNFSRRGHGSDRYYQKDQARGTVHESLLDILSLH